MTDTYQYGSALRAALAQTRGSNPEQEAEIARAARATGAAPSALRAMPREQWPNPAPFDVNTFLNDYPRTAGFLSTPANAAVARDSIPGLSEMERILAAGPFAGQRLVAPTAPAPSIGSVFRGLASSFLNTGRLVVASAEMQAAEFFGQEAPDATRRASDAQYNMARMRPGFENPIARGIYSGAESLVQAVPIIAGTIATRNPLLGVAAAGAVAETTAYPRYRERGATVGEAALGATGEGAVEGATALLPMGFLVNRFGKTGTRAFLAGILAREVPSEQIATLTQDAIDTAIANPDKTWAQYAAERPDAAVQTLIATVTQSLATAGASSATHAIVTQIDRRTADAQAGEAGTAIAENIAAMANNSVVRERDPETFSNFMAQAAEDGPVENIYVDAVTLNQSLADAGVDVEALSAAVPAIGEQLQAAVNSGGDLVIPVEQFATLIAGTDAEGPLIDHLRVDPSLPSRAETKAVSEAQVAEVQAEAERVLSAEETTTAFRESAARVKAQFVEQLGGANRFTGDVNEAYASVVSASYVSLASRLGMTPEEAAAKYPLQIVAEAPSRPADTTLDQEQETELVHFSDNAGLAMSDPSKWGTSSATSNGERARRNAGAPGRTYFGVRDVYAGESAVGISRRPFQYSARVPSSKLYDFDADPQGLRGQLDATGYEQAIQAAGFAGYRSDATVPGAVALFDPTELRAEGPLRTNEDARRVQTRARELEAIWSKAMVAGTVSGPKPDFRAQAMAEMASIPAQPQNEIKTETPAFKAWFGDSKVVDADGNPLVVYHGTMGDFEAFDPADPFILNQSERAPDQIEERAQQLANEIPGLKAVLPLMSSDEKAKLRKDTAAKIVRIIDTLPSAEEMAAVAYSGRAKKGWYENSAKAILEIFGAQDAPRFAALLAALSPQTSVEANLFNALASWTNWINAGRPQDRREIVELLGKSVQGKGTTESVLGAWINNSVTALTTENPAEITLSGPKVNSFMLNLVGVVDEVTNDAWMANYALVEQSLFKKTGAVPGKGPGYIAMSTVARRAAEIVSEKTGDNWSAAEVQETVWSWAKTLYETRDSAGETRTTQQILDAGELTAEEIGATPDFALLFTNGVYRRILTAGGYGERLEALEGSGQAAYSDGDRGDPRSAEGTAFAEDDFRALLGQAAGRLEQLRSQRRGAAQPAEQFTLFQSAAPVNLAPLEGAPGPVKVGDQRIQFGPFAPAREAAYRYMADRGVQYQPPTVYAKVDPERAKRIADAYDAMAHAPNDPQVRAAYRALIDETLAQWKAIEATGLEVEFIDFAATGDPYAATPRMAILDVTQNNHLWVFPTDDGFGSDVTAAERVLAQFTPPEGVDVKIDKYIGPGMSDDMIALQWVERTTGAPGAGRAALETLNALADKEGVWVRLTVEAKNATALKPYYRSLGYKNVIKFGGDQLMQREPKGAGRPKIDPSFNNPMLEMTDVYINGRQLRANDVFRIVHDYYGHIKDGFGFRADGEENAYQSHAAMYSPLARKAAATETRGQNSWVNYGPHAAHNKTASGGDTIYAPQKVGLLPDWAVDEGALFGKDSGTVAGERPAETYAQTNPPFYSALAKAVEQSQTKRASAEQWKATLAKAPGVKKDEIEWSGVNDWLDGVGAEGVLGGYTRSDLRERGEIDGKGLVTREGVLRFLHAGGVQLEEVVLGENSLPPVYKIDFDTEEGIWQVLDEEENIVQTFATNEQAQLYIREFDPNSDTTDSQFSEYKLPGADDTYREVLLTLPAIQGPSTHWDTDNVVAHARITSRQDATGAKVLFIEEVQSDWHQKGRDEGYEGEATPEEKAAALVARDEAYDARNAGQAEVSAAVSALIGQRITELAAAREEARAAGGFVLESIEGMIGLLEDADQQLGRGIDPFRILNQGSLALVRNPQIEAASEVYSQAQLRHRETQIALDALEGGVPDAPFRASWPTLVMKRMIVYAVDTGHDKVAWINGNQQNGGQTGGDGSFFYERNLVNITNDLLKKLGGRVEQIDFRAEEQREMDAGRARDAEGRRLRAIREEIALGSTPEEAAIAVGEQTPMFVEGRNAVQLSIQNGFVINNRMREAAGQGFPLFQQNRGQITFGADLTQSPTVISLLRTADLSTFVHEMGHFQLQVMAQVASSPDAPADIVDDVNALLNWFRPGMTLEEWNAMSPDEKRPYHETFARGTEAYYREGKAPTVELQPLFQRLRTWLLSVYKELAALNVELTDEVRQVMGRMLASQEAIAETEQARGLTPMLETKPDTLSEEAWAEYQRNAKIATEDALDELGARTVRDMQWLSNAKSREMKRLQATNKDQRKIIKAEVTAEVMAEPVNRARLYLRRGVDAEGVAIEGAGKLDLAALQAQYGTETTALWRGLKVGGKFGEAGNEGLNPDAVAEQFGFESGDALVRALVTAEDMNAKIAGITDQRMLERFGDITDEQSLERAANEAVANGARVRMVATEMAITAQLTGQPRALAAVARQVAAGIVNRLQMKRLKPAQFMAAQARAAVAADKAHRKGDVVEAAKQKRFQLINLQAARYAMKAQEEVDKALKLFTRIVSAKDDALARSYDMNLVNAARAILAMHGIGRVKNQPSQYLDMLSRYEPTLYADIKPFVDAAALGAKPVHEMTYEEFQGLRDTVRQLWKLARTIKTIEIDGQRMALDSVREQLGARLDELKPGQSNLMAEDPTEFERDVRGLSGIRAALRRVESWVRGIDGGDTGVFRTYLWNPISEAAARYRTAQATFIERYLEILKPIEATLTQDKIAAPELGFTFKGRQQLLHAILHTGNQSNKAKLLLGRGWGRRLEDGSLDTTRWDAFVARMAAEGKLTRADYDVAQQIWDLLEETKPAAQKAHLEMYGRYFDEVTADEFDTPFGTYRGGYVPALTDSFHVQDAAIRQEENALAESQSGMFPAASNGFTKARVEDYTRELALDMGLLPMHIDKVLKFTHLGPPVRNAVRILKGRAFSAKLQAFDPVAQTDLLLPWLQRAATQVVEVPATGWAGRATDKAFRTIRSRVGMQLMFANVSNTVQQLTGFSSLAVRVKKRNLQRALWAMTRNPKAMAATAAEKSAFMATRTSSQVYEMRQTIDQLLLNPNSYEKARDFAKRHGYFTQQAFQNFADLVGWHAAYDMAIARGDSEKEAVRFADSVIRETQGSMAAEDVAKFESGTAFHRLFTQFLGYSNMTANLNATEIQVVARGIGVKKGAGRLFYVYLMGFAIPALMADAIAQAFRGTAGDEDDDGYLDDFLEWFFGSQTRFALSMVPVVGQITSAALGGFTEKPFDDKISTNPTFSVLESSGRVPSQIAKSVFEGESFDRRDIRDTMTLLGLVTGLPLGTLGKPVGYQAGVMQGDIVPTDPLDHARGLLTGAPSEESKVD